MDIEYAVATLKDLADQREHNLNAVKETSPNTYLLDEASGDREVIEALRMGAAALEEQLVK